MDVTLVVDSLGPRLSGIGRYTWELCKGMPTQAGIDRVNYFANGRFIDDPAALMMDLPTGRGRRRFPRWLTRRLTERRLASGAVHGPNYFLPPEVETGIITVHDLSVLRHPETHPDSRIEAFERQLGSSIGRAAHIITDTETMRQEVLIEFGLRPETVSTIHLGVGQEYRPRVAESLLSPLAKWGLNPKLYGLCVSTLEPRKKVAELIAAWRELPRQIREFTPLVLAGPEGWLNEGLQRQVDAAIAEGWLMHLGFVPEASLPDLYAGATLFVYPSTYEGFGLPPLEAMASGVPVLVSDRSCLPEVCGEAAAYVEPDDVTGFSESIEAALTDRQWRDQARSKGLERAAQFSWRSCIEQTVGIYRRHAH